MSEPVINAEHAASLENWLLPEVGGERVVSAESGVAQRGGYSAGPGRTQPPVTRRRAMTLGQLEALEAQAREEGFQSGRAEGYEKGYAEGQARAAEIAQQNAVALSALVESLTKPFAQDQAQIETLLVELIEALSAAVCLRELQTDNSTITTLVEQAVAALPVGERHISIQVSEPDLALLQSIPDVVKPHWQLLANSQLQAGDCIVESDNSRVDFTRSERLAQVIASVFGDSAEPAG